MKKPKYIWKSKVLAKIKNYAEELIEEGFDKFSLGLELTDYFEQSYLLNLYFNKNGNIVRVYSIHNSNVRQIEQFIFNISTH